MRTRTWPWVPTLAVLAGAAWTPFLGRPLSPDEGGLLVLAGQWSPGTSLYGDYFVDRPPMLIALVGLADAAGDAWAPWALRVLGVLAVVTTVLLAGLVGRLAAPRSGSAPLLPAATAAILVATPLFGSTVVDGELLGLPFLLGGIAALLCSLRAASPGAALGWGLLAGAAGAGGALVKQSLVDVFVVALVLLVARWRTPTAVGLVVGGVLATAVVTGAAYVRGTEPLDLWDAVVVFRQQAATVIAQEATGSTTRRLGGVLLALVASGAPLVVVALARSVRRPRADSTVPDLRWSAAVLLLVELAVVLLGGSYWLHYLMGLVPGPVLLAAAAAQRNGTIRRPVLAAYGAATFSALCVLGWVAVHPIDRPETPVIAYLDRHARTGDTAVVAFGGANILEATGMRSPYPDLWSLPVRVHDPELARLAAVLAGPGRPTWLVVAGTSLDTWGVDGSAAEDARRAHYEPATTAGGFTVYRRSDRS